MASDEIPSRTDNLAPPFLNDRRLVDPLKTSQDQSTVDNARQNWLIQDRKDRSTKRIARRDERRDEVASVLEAEIVGAQVAFECGAVADLSPWQAPAATTKYVDAAAHGVIRTYILF